MKKVPKIKNIKPRESKRGFKLRLLSVLLTVLMISGLAVCASSPAGAVTTDKISTGYKINELPICKYTMAVGETKEFFAYYHYYGIMSVKTSYSNNGVIKVRTLRTHVFVTALKPGKAKVETEIHNYYDMYGKYDEQIDITKLHITVTGNTSTGDTKNPMKVTAKNKTVKASKLKKASVSVSALTVKKAKGKVVYSKISGSKKLSVKSSGKIKVKKGTKKGKYSITVKIRAKGNSKYKPKSIKKTVKIRVN